MCLSTPLTESNQKRPSSAATTYRSIYKEEFTEVRCLGKGGFGVVFEAKKKFDGCSYAVKRITILQRESERERALREVRVLAKLDHVNIVRYHNAWDEEIPPLERNHDPSLSSSNSDETASSENPSTANTSQHSDNEDSFIVFKEPSGEHDNIVETVEESKTDSGSKKEGHKRRWSHGMCMPDGRKQGPVSKMYLYIQLQLCRRDSLMDWLENNLSRQTRGVEVKEIYRQIVSAVEYIHGQGLIHRDLKPSNILFGLDGRVKVSDFGLVTAMSVYSKDGQTPAPARDDLHIHTRGVGTEMYMSPEQLVGLPYGFKVDIYSLGLILIELLHPFRTGTERVHFFFKAKSGRYPQDFLQSHPKEVEVLKLILSEDPASRPTAAGLRARAPLFEPENKRWHYTLLYLPT